MNNFTPGQFCIAQSGSLRFVIDDTKEYSPTCENTICLIVCIAKDDKFIVCLFADVLCEIHRERLSPL